MIRNNLSVAIVDDEDHCRESLSQQIKWSCPELEIIGLASSKKEALTLLSKKVPDILFLDIEMPGGNGFQLLEEVGEVNFAIIFTTAYDEFALDAFRVSAVDYLLKPVDGEELRSAVDKINKGLKHSREHLNTLIRHLNKPVGARKIRFPVSDGFEYVKEEDIVRCESDGAYTHIFLTAKRKLFLSKTLKQVHELIDSDRFIRVHHSHIVNADLIQRYQKGKGGQIILEDGSVVPVSRSKKDRFLDLL